MTKQQIRKLQWLTAHIPARNHIDGGAVVFRVEPLARDGVMLCATNNTESLRWFHQHQHAQVVIGPRGGIVSKSGNLSI